MAMKLLGNLFEYELARREEKNSGRDQYGDTPQTARPNMPAAASRGRAGRSPTSPCNCFQQAQFRPDEQCSNRHYRRV
jgi:hypothetical protein